MEDNTQATDSAIELVYWDMRGLAQPIRHLMEYLGVKYNEKIAESPAKFFTNDIYEIKKRCVSADLPLLKFNGFFVTEYQAIIKFLCRKFNRLDLLGKTPRDAAKIDELMSRFSTHRNRICEKINRSIQYKEISLRRDMVRKQFEEINKGAYWTPVYNEVIKNGWYLGYLSVADFFIYETAFYMDGLFPQEMEKYPLYYNFKKSFEEIPEIKNYQESQRDKINLFMVDVAGLWSGDSKYIIIAPEK